MALIDDVGNFFGGVGDSFGLSDLSGKSANDLGTSFGDGLKDIFSGGIDSLQDAIYGVPTGDPHQVVNKTNTRTPATAAGQYANVKTSNEFGAGATALFSLDNSTMLTVLAVGALLFFGLKK